MRGLIVGLAIFGILMIKGMTAFAALFAAVVAIMVVNGVLSERPRKRRRMCFIRNMKRKLRRMIRIAVRVAIYSI